MQSGSQTKNSSGSKAARCSNCNKKALVLIRCKCSLNTCLPCRNPEDHGCMIDYREEHKKTLKIQNPQISTSKVEKV